MREGEAKMARSVRRALLAAVFTMVFAVPAFAPAFAQGMATVEPTLEECRAFVEENGVPETRPVWENRGYSGWDVCLNMAYDGDLDGYFATADSNSDGRLGADEQAAYMDSILGPMSDPDRSPLTLAKCASMVAEYGIPSERPFVDWSNRGYGDVEICQSLAFDGTLDASFATADANSDGRLDRAEQSSYISSLTAAPNDAPVSAGQDESVVAGNAGTEGAGTEGVGDEGAAQNQYGNAGTAGEPAPEATVAPEITVAPAEPTISAVSEESEPVRTDETDEPETGVLSAVSEAVEKILPDTGGVPLLGVLGGAILLGGGLIAYRFLR